MIQHPIPQNISTYQFRLIGDMTLKQFFILILGIGIAILTYQTNLFAPLKFGIIILSIMVGFVGAFMPIEERPLDQWFVAFIKAIYRPTQFVWKKRIKTPDYFQFTTSPSNLLPADNPDIAAMAIKRKREGLKSFLQTLPEHKLINTLEQFETSSLDNISSLFSGSVPLITNPIQTPTAASSNNITALTPKVALTPTIVEEPIAKPAPVPIRKTPTPITVAPLNPISIERSTKAPPITTLTPPINSTPPPSPQPTINNTASPPKTITTNRPQTLAQTDATLPFPAAPTIPNTAVGMVLDRSGRIIDNAIVEIRDQSHMPVRATKTNKLGQFFSTTPLKNGAYDLEIEKAGHSFPIIKLEAKGAIIPPLKIQATS